MRETLRELLAKYIRVVFDNEAEFLEELTDERSGTSEMSLVEFYMASERTRIVYIDIAGSTITTTISTRKFIDWCEEKL